MEKSQHLSLAQAAALLERSERFVGKLREGGFVKTPAPGQYPLVGLLRGVIAYYEDLESKNSKTASASRATDARTREIELRIRKKMANLIPADVPGEVLDEMAEAVAQEMRRIPSRIHRNPARRAALRAEVEASIARIEKNTAAAKASLTQGD